MVDLSTYKLLEVPAAQNFNTLNDEAKVEPPLLGK